MVNIKLEENGCQAHYQKKKTCRKETIRIRSNIPKDGIRPTMQK